MLYIDPRSWGHVAEWLRNGLQSYGFVEQFHRRILTVGLVSLHYVPLIKGVWTSETS
jgi:hypothetical protein